jgi:hypothetical protein
MILVAVYLAAIVAANLLAAEFGPAITIWNAFFLIGLDLTTRDRLHDRWDGRQLALRMAGLIAAGGLISWVINRDAGPIALASVVAFTLAATCDALVYYRFRERPWLERANASNVVGAAVDSVVFPWLAFGALLPWVTLGQFLAKVGGGFLWSLVLRRWRRVEVCSQCGRTDYLHELDCPVVA